MKCGGKNYSYDQCSACGHPFTKTCPSCGTEMSLAEQQCPQCSLSIRKFGTTRRRSEKAGRKKPGRKKRTTGLGDRWTLIVPVGIAALLILAAVLFMVFTGDDEVDESENPKAGQSTPVDTNADGVPDRWDIYGELGKVVSRKFDENNDGVVERIEFYNATGVVRRAQMDENMDGRFEQMQVYDEQGKLRVCYFYLGDDRQRPNKVDRYNALGGLIERWVDTDGDYVFDHLYQYDAQGRLLLEGTDTKDNGFIDLYLVYRGEDKQIFQRRYDSNGDGVVERSETLNAEGIRIILEEDTDGDGLVEKKTFYHLTGNIRWEQYDTDEDGVFDTFKSYTEEGRYARTGLDTNGDSKPDQWQ